MKKHLVVLATLVCALIFAGACEKVQFVPSSEKQETQKTPEAAGIQGPSVSLNVPTIAIHAGEKTVNVSVDVAVTDEERAKGLGGRESIPKNSGMWFIFPADVSDSFWMKDTLFGLDMIFVSADMKVVDMILNTVPQSTELLTPKAPYRYVLEVPAGFVPENGITIGSTFESLIGPR